MCLGPLSVDKIKGKFMVVSVNVDNSILAFSAASIKRCKAWLSFLIEIPFFFSNSSSKKSTICLSKLSPPRRVSPAVDKTSNIPSPTSKIDTSNVPPPRSNTRICSFNF